MKNRSLWIYAPLQDFIFILMPPFVVLVVLFLLGTPAEAGASDLSDAQWLWLVLAVDVAHVYSTLFRSYFDPEERSRFGIRFWIVPFACFVLGVFLYALGDGVFWRILAYLAVFHFIRQQYGFMRLYSRGEEQWVPKSPKGDFGFQLKLAGILGTHWQRSVDISLVPSTILKRFDAVVIYVLTLYPIWYWHTHDRAFVWFTQNDFFEIGFNDFNIPFYLYLVFIVLYAVKELLLIRRNRSFNVGRNLIIVGTGLSWYFGIVYFNGDLAFTALNVISHGVPYMALVWFYKRKETKEQSWINRAIVIRWGWLVLIAVVLVFAFVEEALWDGLVWQEHSSLFPFVKSFSVFDFSPHFIWLVPLLSLPQTTHYVLDGIIWKK